MEIQIQDQSGDRKYFTIIPNFILNHSTAIAQALYLQLKRLAGENGIAYSSRAYLMNQLCISKPTLLKELGYLLEKGWIEQVEDVSIPTEGGIQKMKSYKVVDLWDLNNKFYSDNKGVKNNTPLAKGVKNRPPKKILYPIKNNSISNNLLDKDKEIKNKERELTPSEQARLFFNEEKPETKQMFISYLIEKGIPENVVVNEIAKFVRHWTERNKSGTKQRWEMEKTFEVGRRLATWFTNYAKWNKGSEKQNRIL